MSKIDWFLHLPVCVGSTAVFWYLNDALVGIMWLAAQLVIWNVSFKKRKRETRPISDRQVIPPD